MSLIGKNEEIKELYYRTNTSALTLSELYYGNTLIWSKEGEQQEEEPEGSSNILSFDGLVLLSNDGLILISN